MYRLWKKKEDTRKRRRGINGEGKQDRIIEYRNLLYEGRITVYLEKEKKTAREGDQNGV